MKLMGNIISLPIQTGTIVSSDKEELINKVYHDGKVCRTVEQLDDNKIIIVNENASNILVNKSDVIKLYFKSDKIYNLKEDDWNTVIQNNLVNSDKTCIVEKINSHPIYNNLVTYVSSDKTYTRHEVIQLMSTLLHYVDKGNIYYYPDGTVQSYNTKWFDNWIKENIK